MDIGIATPNCTSNLSLEVLSLVSSVVVSTGVRHWFESSLIYKVESSTLNLACFSIMLVCLIKDMIFPVGWNLPPLIAPGTLDKAPTIYFTFTIFV